MVYGAGSSPAGSGVAGLGEEVPLVVTTPGVPPVLRYDPVARDWVTLSSGELANCHPVDQQMSLGLTLRLGSVPAYPILGNTIHEIGPEVSGDQLQRSARLAVESAYPVSLLLSEGSVAIENVVATRLAAGSLQVETFYRNLEADGDELLRIYSEI